MKEKSLENKIIRMIIRHLLFRNALLATLLTYLILKLYLYSSFMKILCLVLVIVFGLCYIFQLGRIIRIKSNNKDSEIIQSFNDEYFRSIWIKAGYHGFVTMMAASLILIIISLTLTSLKLQIFIPIYLIGGIMVFTGIIGSDVSKILQIRD